MRKALEALGLMLGLAYLPLQLYQSWLIYQHIKATEFLWLLWWISFPIFIITTIISNVFLKLLKEDQS